MHLLCVAVRWFTVLLAADDHCARSYIRRHGCDRLDLSRNDMEKVHAAMRHLAGSTA